MTGGSKVQDPFVLQSEFKDSLDNISESPVLNENQTQVWRHKRNHSTLGRCQELTDILGYTRHLKSQENDIKNTKHE